MQTCQAQSQHKDHSRITHPRNKKWCWHKRHCPTLGLALVRRLLWRLLVSRLALRLALVNGLLPSGWSLGWGFRLNHRLLLLRRSLGWVFRLLLRQRSRNGATSGLRSRLLSGSHQTQRRGPTSCSLSHHAASTHGINPIPTTAVAAMLAQVDTCISWNLKQTEPVT
jgi:hypothetical protein